MTHGLSRQKNHEFKYSSRVTFIVYMAYGINNFLKLIYGINEWHFIYSNNNYFIDGIFNIFNQINMKLHKRTVSLYQRDISVK